MLPNSHPTHNAASASSVSTATSEHASPNSVSVAAEEESQRPVLQRPVVIIGAGPAGLSTALMLARRGYYDIRV